MGPFFGQTTRGVTPLKKTLSQQLSIASNSSTRAGLQANLSVPCWDFVLFKLAQVLCTQSQPVWVHMCNCPTVLREHCSAVVIHCLWRLQSFCFLFHDMLWALGWGVWNRCPNKGEVSAWPFLEESLKNFFGQKGVKHLFSHYSLAYQNIKNTYRFFKEPLKINCKK